MAKYKYLKEDKTVRGFSFVSFIDTHKQQCSIQKSSVATEDCIWLGVDVDLNGEKVYGRMHLTQDMTKELVRKLNKFIRTGDL